MTLYMFITHRGNIDNCYQRIVNMMVDDYVIVCGGSDRDYYDSDSKILNLCCNDLYVGLPEKVSRAFNYIIRNSEFNKYSHIFKLDDDMILVSKSDFSADYLGRVHYGDGNRNWHIGRCGNFWDKVPYLGEFKPWCMGGFGYVISFDALRKVMPNFDYLGHIYEDVYIGLLMNKIGIEPENIDTTIYFKSPDH